MIELKIKDFIEVYGEELDELGELLRNMGYNKTEVNEYDLVAQVDIYMLLKAIKLYIKKYPNDIELTKE